MTNKQYRKKERRWKNDYKADSWHLGYIGYSDRLIKQWINKYAGEMKRGERRKDVWYRCKQGGEKMNEETIMVIVEVANAILDALDD